LQPKLPPPDPYESLGLAEGIDLPRPMAVFLYGPPSTHTSRLSDAILDLRPGALFIVAAD
jgi:hypothetical protein